MTLILALTILGILLLVVEAFIPLFGLWGLSGLTLLITGLILSLNDSLMNYGFGAVLAVAFVLALLCGSAGLYGYRVYQEKNKVAKQDLTGMKAVVLDWDGKQGRVRVDEKSWHAYSEKKYDIKAGDIVIITEADGLTLTVKPKEP